MTAQKRGRGRPKGSGKDDLPVLRAMADLMVEKPGLKATSAYKRVERHWHERDLRRIQMKWREQGHSLLADVRNRKRAALGVTTSNREIALMRAAKQAERAVDTMTGQLGGIRKLYGSPTQRAISDFLDSPTQRAMREFVNSPAQRAVREFFDSPIQRAIRDLHDSPMQRFLRRGRGF